MSFVVPPPAIVTDRDPGRDPELRRLLARLPSLECVVVRSAGDIGGAARAVADAILSGRAVRLRALECESPAAAAVEAGRDAAALTVGTLVGRADEWLGNVVTACPALLRLPGADVIAGAWHERPALVVGAGPSLDEAGDDVLRRLAETCVVIATGSGLAPLARRGIRADLAVVIEGADCSAQFAAPVRTRDALVALAQHGHPAHLSVPCAGRIRLDMAENAWFAALAGSRTIVPSAGNVGATALWLAVHAGCGPIVLAGLDFAFGTSGGHHAEGATSGAFGGSGGRPVVVEAAGGGQAASNALLSSYRRGVESIVRGATTGRVLNLLAPGKARIAGAREVAGADALAAVLGSHAAPRHRLPPALLQGRHEPHDAARAVSHIVDELGRFESFVESALRDVPDDAALRPLVAAACRARPGSLEAALFHGHVLDPEGAPRAVLSERLDHSRRYRALLEERVVSCAGRSAEAAPGT